MKKCKLLFVVVSLQNSNGTERAVVNLVNTLPKSKFDITVLSILKQDYLPLFNIDSEVTLMDLGYINYSFTTIIRSAKKIASIEKKNRYDYYISSLFYISIGMILFGMRNVVAWEHVAYDYHPVILRKIRNLVYRNSTAVICQTKFDLDKYQMSLSNVRCIPNIVNLDLKLVKNNIAKQVLVVTRFSPEKGIDLLYNIIEKMFVNKQDGYKFVLVGDGILRDEFMSKAKVMIDSGFLIMENKTDKIEQFYADSDILILTSKTESFGLVIIEAFLYGLPVVAFKIDGGPATHIISGVNGYLINPFNIDEFVEKIEFLLENDHVVKNMSLRNRVKGLNYSPEIVMHYWLDVLDKK